MDKVQEISELLSDLKTDLRAEIIVEGLIENGLINNDWIVTVDGLFKRGYAKDLTSTENLEFDNQKMINFHLSRDGIYDSLPEGLFHPISDKATFNGHEMAVESRKERKREHEIRKFFAPFEQEFFNIRLLTERKERHILTRLIQGQMSDFFTKFWKIDESLNKELVEKMVAYLPFAQKIVGNYSLTFNLLESIIQEKISYNIIRSRNSDEFDFENDKTSGFTLGEASLSWDFVCGNTMMDLTPLVKITIGPIQNSPLVDYFEGGKIREFIDYFCGFFLPLEVDYTLVLETSNNKEFKLPELNEELIMGFDTYI